MGAVCGLAVSTLAATSAQTTKKISEIKKQVETSPIKFSAVLEATRKNSVLKGTSGEKGKNAVTGFDQEIKATKAISSTESLRLSVRMHKDIVANEDDTAHVVGWIYGQYANSKSFNIGGKNFSTIYRAYLPSGHWVGGLDGKGSANGLLTQFRMYQSTNLMRAGDFSAGLTFQERLYIGDDRYMDVSSNRAARLRITADLTYKINSVLDYGLYMGPNIDWTNKSVRSEGTYIWSEVNAKVASNITLTLAGEALHAANSKGVQFLAGDDVVYYLYGTVNF